MGGWKLIRSTAGEASGWEVPETHMLMAWQFQPSSSLAALRVTSLQGFTKLDARNRFYKAVCVAQRHTVTLGLKSSTGPFSEPEKEKSIRKQQICNTRRKPTVEARASIPHDSRLLRKGSSVIHSLL